MAVGLRWIFARIHGLPAAFRLAGSNTLFTNESMRVAWKNYGTHSEWHKDALFRASLNYVNGMTYTHSLIQDSYPVEISADNFSAGVHHLDMHSRDTGHTMFVYRTGLEYGGYSLIYSNVPAKVRTMYVTGFYNADPYTKLEEGGFFKVRWPVVENNKWSLTPRAQMPGYSLEQYAEEFRGEHNYFYKAILENLGHYHIDPMDQYEQLKFTVMQLIDDRILAVEEGYAFCQANDCAPGTAHYEEWSTPSRDRRIKTVMDTIEDISYDSTTVFWAWDAFRKKTNYTLGGRSATLDKIVKNFQWGKYSSDPNKSIRRRWGL